MTAYYAASRSCEMAVSEGGWVQDYGVGVGCIR